MESLDKLTCQICFDDISQRASAVTKICGATCPAVICKTCFIGHLSIALQVGYVGALPRVRCPVCLVPLHKSQWGVFDSRTTMTADGKLFVFQEYARLCKLACSFRTPCCHDASYTQLPDIYFISRAAPPACKLPVSQVPVLQRKCQQFSRHRLSARDLLNYITDTFPDRSEEIVYAILPRMEDEERRAMLLLTYHHVVDSVVMTTCCMHPVCFNCKRSLLHSYDCTCKLEDATISEACDLIECRNCHVTLVKVEGCDAVVCMCGFAMWWSEELESRKDAQQQQASGTQLGRRRRRREAQAQRLQR